MYQRKLRRNICVHCGKLFTTRSSSTQTCSRACALSWQAWSNNKKVCPTCGHEGYREKALCIKCRPKAIDQEGISWQSCPICGHRGYRKQPYCKRHEPASVYQALYCGPCPAKASRTPPVELDRLIHERYPSEGPEPIAEALSMSVQRVKRRAQRLKVTLSKDGVYRKRLYADVAQRMREHNPSHAPGAREQLRERTLALWRERPDIPAALFAGHRRLQRDKPSKLELRLFSYLDRLGVSYESHHLIKPKFIVDALISDNLIIEADGDWWHGHPRFEPLRPRQIAQQKRDVARNRYLAVRGFTVERIWECDMTLERVCTILKKHGFVAS